MYLNYIKIKLIFEINELSSPFTGKDLFISQLKNKEKRKTSLYFIYIYIYIAKYAPILMQKKKKDTEVEQFCSFGSIFLFVNHFFLNSRILCLFEFYIIAANLQMIC